MVLGAECLQPPEIHFEILTFKELRGLFLTMRQRLHQHDERPTTKSDPSSFHHIRLRPKQPFRKHVLTSQSANPLILDFLASRTMRKQQPLLLYRLCVPDIGLSVFDSPSFVWGLQVDLLGTALVAINFFLGVISVYSISIGKALCGLDLQWGSLPFASACCST